MQKYNFCRNLFAQQYTILTHSIDNLFAACEKAKTSTPFMNDINPVILLLSLIGLTLWHELGHILAARWLGIPIVNVYIGLGPELWRRKIDQSPNFVLRAFPLGMSIAIPSHRDSNGSLQRTYAQDLLIAAAGPISSLLLTLILFAVARWVPMPVEWAYGLIGVGLLSTALALLNLLPIPGLDGGHLLLAFASYKGYHLSREREQQLQNAGVKWVGILSLIPLVYILGTKLLQWLM